MLWGFDNFAAMIYVNLHSQTLFSYLGMMKMLKYNILVFPNNFPYCQHILCSIKKLESGYMGRATG
jgi:hypothetical protein